MDEPRQLARPEPETGSKTELLLKFKEESTHLVVIVKLPGEIPRILPGEIDADLNDFLADFDSIWRDVGDAARDEFVRGATGRGI